MLILYLSYKLLVNVTSGLHWSHCTDVNEEGKFTCNSEDRWPSDVYNLRRGVHKNYVTDLPKLRFATTLLEPNDGYIEPCFTLSTDANDPENFTNIPKEAICLEPKPYLCRKEIHIIKGLLYFQNFSLSDFRSYLVI